MAHKILVVDDSITIHKVIELALSEEDYELTFANNGISALKKINDAVPDLILADIIMPEMNGYDLCEKIKHNQALKHIPIILLKGTFEASDERREKEVGAEDIIIKPFESNELVDKVKKWLEAKPEEVPTEEAAVAEAEPEKEAPEELELEEEVMELAEEEAAPEELTLEEEEIMELGEETAAFEAEPEKAAPQELELEEIEPEEQPPTKKVAPVFGDKAKEEAVEDSWNVVDLTKETAPETAVEEEKAEVSEEEILTFDTLDEATQREREPAPQVEETPIEQAAEEEIELPATEAVQEPVKTEEVISEGEKIDKAALEKTAEKIIQEIAPEIIKEISKKIIEQVTWEVIPDLAEMIIKKEVEKIKAKFIKPE